MSREKSSQVTTLGERLLRARKEAGLTQEKLAIAVGLRKSHISRVENNQGRLSPMAILAISQALGIERSWLERDEGEMRSAASGVAEGRPSYIKEPRSWQAALEPCLAGTSLEGALSRPQLLGGLEEDQAWRELPDPKKEDIRRQLRQFAFTAVAADALEEPFRTDVLDALSIQLINYITAQLRKPD